MTHYATDPTQPGDLIAENARLRLAIAHLAVYARAVLECRDNGGLTLAHVGYPAYQASHALAALEECVTRVLAGDWRPLTAQQIDAAWDAHAKRSLWSEETMTRKRWQAALNDLLWHPERQFTVAQASSLPTDGTAGFADEVAGLYGFKTHD